MNPSLERVLLGAATYVPLLVLPWSVPVWCLAFAWYGLVGRREDYSGHGLLVTLAAPSVPFLVAAAWLLNRSRR